MSALASPQLLAGRYELVRELGRGGMGVVYEAFDRFLERPVALKRVLIDRGHGTDPAQHDRDLQRFFQEARLTARIAHPNVVVVHDVGALEDGDAFIVMELLRGAPLSDRLEGMPAVALVNVLADACDGLGAAHDAGLVHRDLKPTNIFLTDDTRPRAVVVDFGIAKFATEGERITTTGNIVGSPFYMAPEQAAGEEVTYATDLYALGVVLYEFFSGRAPFGPAASPIAYLSSVVYKAPDPLGDVCPGLPVEVVRLVMRILSRDPRHRPGSARELAAELRRLVPVLVKYDGTGTMARPLPPAATPSLARKRASPWTYALVAACLVGVLGLGFAATARFVGKRSRTEPAPARTVDATGIDERGAPTAPPSEDARVVYGVTPPAIATTATVATVATIATASRAQVDRKRPTPVVSAPPPSAAVSTPAPPPSASSHLPRLL